MKEVFKPSIKRIAIFLIFLLSLGLPHVLFQPFILFYIFFLPLNLLDLLHININIGANFLTTFVLERLQLLSYGLIIIICYLLAGFITNSVKRKSVLDALIVFIAFLFIIFGTLFEIWQFNASVTGEAKGFQKSYMYGIIGILVYLISIYLIYLAIKRKTSKYIFISVFILFSSLLLSAVFINLTSSKYTNFSNRQALGPYLQADPVFRQTTPPYVFTFSGEVRKDSNNKYTVKYNPFYFISSNKKWLNLNIFKNDFSIVLKKENKVLKRESLEVKECTVTSFEGCPKYNYDQGFFSHSFFNLKEMPDEISILYKDNEIYSIKEPKEPSNLISINHQEFNGDNIIIMWNKPKNYQQFSYYARIFINGENSNTISGKDMVDANGGLMENSLTFDPYNYNWDHGGDFQVEIVATDGFKTYKAISDVIPVIDVPRFGKIEISRDSWTQGQDVVLQADSYNPDTRLHCDGCAEEGNTFLWESNIDGRLSTKPEAWCRYLSPGKHLITLTVSNINGQKAIDTTAVTILPSDDISNTEWEAKKSKGEICY